MSNNTLIDANENAIVATKNISKKEKFMKALEYSLPAILSILIFLFAMIIKGVYPFGNESFGYIDFNDGLVPSYTNLWDILHGKANALVNWNLGAGGSVVTSAVINGFLSPISWLIALFPREQIIYGISFLVIVKFALMATTAYICFKKFFPNVNKWVLLLFSLVWTFSGWTIVHYTNIGWLDIMILLPLLILSSKKLVNEGKILWFVIILSYMLMLSYYISYMVLVGVVVIATIYICTMASNKKRVASSLFFAIIISILISMVAFIPSCLTSLQSHRFSGSSSSGIGVLFEYFTSKLMVLIMHALPFVFFVRLMLSYKKDKKTVLFFMLSFIVCSLGLIIEPINQMWHTGSYFSFPFRYSFVIILLMIFGSLYYLNNHNTVNEDSEAKDINEKKLESKLERAERITRLTFYYIFLAISLVATIALIVYVAYIGAMAIPYKQTQTLNFCIYLLLFIISYVLIELLLRLKNNKLKLGKINGGILIFVLCLLQIFGLMTGYTGLSQGTETERVYNVYNINTSSLEAGYKIKDREVLYNYNFPQLLNYPSMSTWIHISSEEQWHGYTSLGYGSASTLLYSSGGTLLTDVLLGNRYVLSKESLDSNIYTLLDSFDYKEENGKISQVFLYELNFNFSKALLTNANLNTMLNDCDNALEASNILYKALYNEEQNIIDSVNFNVIEQEDCFEISVTYSGYGVLYMLNSGAAFEGEVIGASAREFFVGINDLGSISSNTVTLKIYKDNNLTIDSIKQSLSFGVFDVNTFKTVHNGIESSDISLSFDGETINLSVDNASNYKYLFVPYTYLKNMTVTINGSDNTVITAFDTFMMVELEEGENNISLTYKPQYIKACLIITIISIVVFAVFAIINHKYNIASKKFVVWTGFVGACIILFAVGFLVYLRPLFNFFVILFTG